MANRPATPVRSERGPLDAVRVELAALSAMTTGELAEKYLAMFGVPTRTRNKEYLRRHIAWRLQAQLEGHTLSRRAVEQLAGLAPQAPVRWRAPAPPLGDTPTSGRAAGNRATERMPAKSRRAAKRRDPRLPPAGTVISRVYAGVAHEVTVREDRFEFAGTAYRSLSRIAKVITGQDWNGFRFFFGNAGQHNTGDACEE